MLVMTLLHCDSIHTGHQMWPVLNQNVPQSDSKPNQVWERADSDGQIGPSLLPKAHLEVSMVHPMAMQMRDVFCQNSFLNKRKTLPFLIFLV